jgi:hypothetical protein
MQLKGRSARGAFFYGWGTRSDDQENIDREPGDDAGRSRQPPLMVPLRPVDPGGAALGDQRGVEFG